MELQLSEQLLELLEPETRERVACHAIQSLTVATNDLAAQVCELKEELADTRENNASLRHDLQHGTERVRVELAHCKVSAAGRSDAVKELARLAAFAWYSMLGNRLAEETDELLENERKIGAIRCLKNKLGVSLLVAKSLVDARQDML
jgi:hypothetical protein